jgi:hypothetical protein
MNFKHLIIAFALVVMVVVVLFQLAGCGSGSGSDYPDFYSNEISGVERIEAFHLEHFPVTSADESTDNRAIYVDFSDGITKYALSDDNNKDVYKMLFKVADVYPSIEYFELSNDQLIQYIGSGKMAYFTDGGFEDNDGELKQGAPIDQAINAIVERDNVGVLVTDGELYNSELKEVSEDTWASKAFEKWLNKGHELVIVYTDFVEKNKGGAYDKHMYVMFFIPNNHTEMLDNYISELDEEGLEYDSMSFSTNTNNLYRRDYPNSQLPGSSQYLEYFGDPAEYYRSETSAMEYVDMTPADFHCDEDGLVYYLRDLGNPITGKPQSYPIFEKLYFSFTSLSNYNVKELKLGVHDVYEDFKSYKKNVLARENLPVLEKSIFDGKDSLNDANYLVFNGMSLVDDEEPYDTSKVTVKDTIDGFVSKLKNEFKFNPTSFETTEKGVQDFLYLDKNAGLISETYAEGEYEIILKLSDKLNENNAYLNNQRSNLFRIDIILDVVEPTPIDKEALTWKRIDDGEVDDALYRSLKNIMKKEDVKPHGVVYSYYVKLAPFNQ